MLTPATGTTRRRIRFVDQTIKGLERSGGGIVAMQDIQPATARALPLAAPATQANRSTGLFMSFPHQPQANAGAKNVRVGGR